MQPIITENRERIAELCRTHHVRQLSVFGSAIRDDFDQERSDIDFLVDFNVPLQVRYAPNFFALQRSLAQLLVRDVDLVVLGSVTNPFLRNHIELDARLLYAS